MMDPQELLRAMREVYVLVNKPGAGETEDKKFWSMRLPGLHRQDLSSSVKAFRKQRGEHEPKGTKSLQSTPLYAALAHALGAPSWEHWIDNEQDRLLKFLDAHDMCRPADLISWSNAPWGRLTAQSVANRLFNSGRPLPQRIFTGVGSKWLRAKGYGRYDLHQVSRMPFASDEELVDWCEQHADEEVLRAFKARDWEAGSPEYVDLTGRELLFQALQFEALSCAYNMLGDNLVHPALEEPELRLYNASREEIAVVQRVFRLFRQAMLGSLDGWVEILPVPENPNILFLKGADGQFDWVLRDQRGKPPPPPLHPMPQKEHPSAMLWRQRVAMHLYFKRGEWSERLEHDADQRHYASGGTAADWTGYDKLVLRELIASKGYEVPRAPSARAKHGFVRHRVNDCCLMISPLITVGEFWRFYEDSAWRRERERWIAKGGDELEKDLAAINLGDRSDRPASLTWYDAVAYCAHVERETGLPVRLLEVEEWRQICPAPQWDLSDRTRVDLTRVITGDQHGKGGTLHFRGDPPLFTNAEGLAFVRAIDFGEWLADYAHGHACAANPATGRALMTGPLRRDRCAAHLSMRYKGLKVGFRLCYVADSDS